MKKTSVLLALFFESSSAHASDMSGLVYLIILQYVFYLWPFVLPLFYLGNQHRKLRTYFLFVLIIFGVLGILRYPYSLLISLDLWPAGGAYPLAGAINIVINAVAFLICIWYLPRFRKLFLEKQV